MHLLHRKDTLGVHKIASMHYKAYKEKFKVEQRSDNFKDYILSTLQDIAKHKVLYTTDYKGLLVLEDRTDPLLRNSTYHLVLRIYVLPKHRGKGIAKQMIREAQASYGTLMGYNGKFYIIKEL